MKTLSTHSLAFFAVLVSALSTGCGGDKAGEPSAGAASSGKPSSSAKPGTAAKPGTTTAAAAPVENAKPAELVEHDLSSADPKWAGWVAKAPADAKVMQDGTAGARLAVKGPNMLDRKVGGDNGIDVAFAWGKNDLKDLKTNLEKGAAASPADFKMTLTFTKDEADMLEWTSESGKSKSYSFVKHMKVDGKDITCKNNYMIGSGNEAEHKRAMDVCATLAKK